MKNQEIYEILSRMFPDARCELNFTDPYQLTIAVLLSAQTTDIAVNKVTAVLFAKYPTVKELAQAKLVDVEKIIHSLGLYHNKAKHIIALAQVIVADHDHKIPNEREALMKLPGIGRKSANVILADCFNVPALAVDTHVERVAKRLGIARWPDSVLITEQKLMEAFPTDQWIELHHLFIFFGRYRCKAQNPLCEDCPFLKICQKDAQV